MLRPHISRLENGHTVPSFKTLEKMAHALEVSIDKLFLGVEQAPKASIEPIAEPASESTFGSTRGERRFLTHFHRMLGRISPTDRRLLFALAQKMASRAK
jgi:transcriptional regulator with XRE-family HTH domain